MEVTSENRQEVDRLIHGIVGAEYQDCPATWREVKKRLAEGEEDFISKLGEEWKGLLENRKQQQEQKIG